MPSDGEKKIESKIRKKTPQTPFGSGFGKSSEKHTKNRNFGKKKDTIGEQSLRDSQICKNNSFLKAISDETHDLIEQDLQIKKKMKSFNYCPSFLIFK